MSLLPLDSSLHRDLLGDPELAALMDERADIAAMIEAERALARAQGRLGVIPEAAAETIDRLLAAVVIAPQDCAAGMARDGVLAPALVAHLRERLPEDAANWLHWGATSQDMADLSLLIRLKQVLGTVDKRLDGLITLLADLAQKHDRTICLAHTRMQAAAPTLFGLRVAGWLAPLIRHRQRLREMRPRLLAAQCGGAVGNLASLGMPGLAVMDALADELGLTRAEPWHTARDRIIECGTVFASLSASLGKIGLDLMLMAQSEIGEASFAGAGGSSTLPQKQNPVRAEVLQSLARHAATLAGGLLHAGQHAGERDGVNWTLEWLTLPQLIVTTGAATLRTQEMLQSLTIHEDRMAQNIAATRGLVLAEAATFALAAHMPRQQASALVKKAVAETLASDQHLFTHLAAMSDAPVAWDALRAPHAYLEPARGLIARVLALLEVRSG